MREREREKEKKDALFCSSSSSSSSSSFEFFCDGCFVNDPTQERVERKSHLHFAHEERERKKG